MKGRHFTMTKYPYKTREGGATVTIFVPYDCGNNCPFCINKQEYENPVGFSLEAICESIRTMDEITPKCDFVFTGGEPFADLDALQTMLDLIPPTHNIFINTALPTLHGVTEDDLVAFTEGVCRMFDFPAKERDIHFTFDHEGLDKLDAWIDRTQFDKVISNLLSNAFKYSTDGGSVAVNLKRLDSDGGMLELSVSDNGVGIDEDSLKHIFDRFYQGSNSRRMHVNGTGIGLNLCKMIVGMHHGTIEAHNRTDDKGAVFTVRLPLGKDHLKPEELDTQTEIVQLSRAKTSSSKYHVLIVDDDLEMARYVSSELGRYYKFGICPNGKEGLKELLTNEYDVVVSDVMMPEMDGFTMLRMVKTNINISHIPVIMLTSKADVANRLEGLERGADAFLAKPFDMEELHMVIENLVQSRLRLKGKYSGAQQAQAEKVDQPEVRGNDEVLMERIMKAINKNISDSDFNVERLTQEVGISRVQLHRKMKELTGISTSEFIRNIRLEQAARLLKEQKINVTQVAYTVGFSNLAHFSTIFRKHFGVAPSEYAEREG